MKVLFLGGIFPEGQEAEILNNTKCAVDYAANNFQKKLLKGLAQTGIDYEVISAPFIGAFPHQYKQIKYEGYISQDKNIKYVPFNNIFALRNFSRAKNVKKNLQSFIRDKEKEKLIIIYSAHTPFLKAAAYAKRKDRNIKICNIIPDLPQYMNLNKKKSVLYRIGKRIDIKTFQKFMLHIDSYMFLTEHMATKLDVRNRPVLVREGIIGDIKDIIQNNNLDFLVNAKKNIVYTGTLNLKYGIKELIDAFISLKNPDYRLIICGKGDGEYYVKEKAIGDTRIEYKGQVSSMQAKEWVNRADVLVNPRQNNEEYTKYSFPSKNIEYLISGKPVVAYMLDGMKDIYQEFLIIPKNNSLQALAESIEVALTREYSNDKFVEYCKANLLARNIINKIIEISYAEN